MANSPGEELFDVVDRDDVVVGQAGRADVHKQGLLHRAVHMFVFNSAGELLIHLRSAGKDEFPGVWTSSACGHVDAGESYDAAASRELREELGLDTSLERLAKFPAGRETANEHTVLYRTSSDQVPEFDRKEIEQIAWQAPLEVLAAIRETPDRYSPVFRMMLEWTVAASQPQSEG